MNILEKYEIDKSHNQNATSSGKHIISQEVANDLRAIENDRIEANRMYVDELARSESLDRQLAELKDRYENQSLKSAIKQVLCVVYHGSKRLIITLIWGGASYKNTAELLQQHANDDPISSHKKALAALDVIITNDAQNVQLLFRSSKVRKAIYESLRSVNRFMKKVLRRAKRIIR